MKNKYVRLLRRSETADNPEGRRWALHIPLLVRVDHFLYRDTHFDEQRLLYAVTRFTKKRNES